MDNNEIILRDKNDFPEFENIRKTILEAGEKFGQGFVVTQYNKFKH